jgi:putative ABC transport system ATP-binding protein
VTALRGVSFDVHRHEMVGITGPSGSGKSTVLQIIGLLDTATAGDYQLDGVDVAALGEVERAGIRARRFGFVFQAFHLLGRRSALDNVALGALYTYARRAERERRAAEALADVGLAHRLHALPSTMSGGERQRVAIARAVVNRPDLLLCDEPTGNLDSANAAAVLDLLDELRSGGLTVVLITHDEQVAARASRRLTIVDGALAMPA